jgi:hypothetical protein
VSSTILMVIVLVVMWLVVLVPMFVRRHDDRSEVRSVDQFAAAMRVLSRRTAAVRAASGARHPLIDPVERTRLQARAEVRALMLARRRRTAVLLSTLVVAGPIGALLITPWLWLLHASAAVLLAGFLAQVRRQVIRERSSRWSALSTGAVTDANPQRARTAASPAQGQPADPRRHSSARRSDATLDRRPPPPPSEEPADGWRPSPVPTPTYVAAPVARPAAGRMVELDDGDPTFAELDEIVAEPTAPDVEAVELAERQRAVNE